jgi:hypothetical protein
MIGGDVRRARGSYPARVDADLIAIGVGATSNSKKAARAKPRKAKLAQEPG